MSAFLYSFKRELITLNVGDFQFQNGLKFKKVASKFCEVSFNEAFARNDKGQGQRMKISSLSSDELFLVSFCGKVYSDSVK